MIVSLVGVAVSFVGVAVSIAGDFANVVAVADSFV